MYEAIIQKSKNSIILVVKYHNIANCFLYMDIMLSQTSHILDHSKTLPTLKYWDFSKWLFAFLITAAVQFSQKYDYKSIKLQKFTYIHYKFANTNAKRIHGYTIIIHGYNNNYVNIHAYVAMFIIHINLCN